MVISGDGRVGNVSSARMDLTAPLIDPQPVRVKERAMAITMEVIPRDFLMSSMWVIMYAGADKWGFPNKNNVEGWVCSKSWQRMNLRSRS